MSLEAHGRYIQTLMEHESLAMAPPVGDEPVNARPPSHHQSAQHGSLRARSFAGATSAPACNNPQPPPHSTLDPYHHQGGLALGAQPGSPVTHSRAGWGMGTDPALMPSGRKPVRTRGGSCTGSSRNFYYFSAYKIVWAWNQNELSRSQRKRKAGCVYPPSYTRAESLPYFMGQRVCPLSGRKNPSLIQEYSIWGM